MRASRHFETGDAAVGEWPASTLQSEVSISRVLWPRDYYPPPDPTIEEGGNLIVDVRRLAAIDMHGLHGRGRRRRWVLVEFVAGVIGPLPAAAALLIFSDGAGRLLLGIWLIGIAANYVPLALHAVSLSRDGAL